jgi:hypothetical protein
MDDETARRRRKAKLLLCTRNIFRGGYSANILIITTFSLSANLPLVRKRLFFCARKKKTFTPANKESKRGKSAPRKYILRVVKCSKSCQAESRRATTWILRIFSGIYIFFSARVRQEWEPRCVFSQIIRRWWSEMKPPLLYTRQVYELFALFHIRSTG